MTDIGLISLGCAVLAIALYAWRTFIQHVPFTKTEALRGAPSFCILLSLAASGGHEPWRFALSVLLLAFGAAILIIGIGK
jgi:hypothetical protein